MSFEDEKSCSYLLESLGVVRFMMFFFFFFFWGGGYYYLIRAHVFFCCFSFFLFLWCCLFSFVMVFVLLRVVCSFVFTDEFRYLSRLGVVVLGLFNMIWF